MKVFVQLSLLSLAVRGFCRSVSGRNLQAVKNVLSQVQSGVDFLDSSINGFNSDPRPITSAADNLISTVELGTGVIQGLSNLSLMDSLTLIPSVQDLQAHTQTLSNDLKAKRPNIQGAKQCDVTRDKVANINTASQALIDTIVSKIPPEAQSIAKDQAYGITRVLAEAGANFTPSNCNDI